METAPVRAALSRLLRPHSSARQTRPQLGLLRYRNRGVRVHAALVEPEEKSPAHGPNAARQARLGQHREGRMRCPIQGRQRLSRRHGLEILDR